MGTHLLSGMDILSSADVHSFAMLFFQRPMHCKMIVGGLGVDVGNMMLSKI